MKKQMEKEPKRVIPAFQNRNIHGKQLLAAVKKGDAPDMTKEKLRGACSCLQKSGGSGGCITYSRGRLGAGKKAGRKKG